MNTYNHLARDTRASSSQRVPVTTITVLVSIAIVTGVQFVYPGVLEALRRNPTAFAAGEWWRLLTPLLVHADGWQAFVFNSLGIALVGPTVERIFGSWRWILLFLVGGLLGNVAGYAWEPYGAGSSVGMFGLVGGLFVWLLLRAEHVWPVTLAYIAYIIPTLLGHAIGATTATDVLSLLAAVVVGSLLRLQRVERTVVRVVCTAGLLGALMLALLHDNHGPAIVAGACVGALLERGARNVER